MLPSDFRKITSLYYEKKELQSRRTKTLLVSVTGTEEKQAIRYDTAACMKKEKQIEKKTVYPAENCQSVS